MSACIDLAAFRAHEAQNLLTARSHPTADLIIWNYTAKCQFMKAWDEVTMQARGLITKADGTIVSRPFPKFKNYGEDPNQVIPHEPFKVTEKMDGSLGISYHINGQTFLATRGSFTSEQAIKANEIVRNRYQDFVFSPSLTYLFEIIFPANRIVVDYGDREDLILLAVIDTQTGQEYDIHNPSWICPFPLVQEYTGIQAITELIGKEEANKEGFVVRFQSGLRLKVKMAEYVRIHALLTHWSTRMIWEMLKNKQSIDALLEKVPDELYMWMTMTQKQLLTQFAQIEEKCQSVAQQVKHVPTRKEQASMVLSTAYPGPVFRMLDGKDYADLIWKMIKPEVSRLWRSDVEE